MVDQPLRSRSIRCAIALLSLGCASATAQTSAGHHKKPASPEEDKTIVPAQRLALPVDPSTILVKTQLNHISVIELPEEIDTFTCGSDQVLVQAQKNRVVVQPESEGVETNLVVWTRSFKQIYEVLPAGDERGEMYIKTPYPPGIGLNSPEAIESSHDALVTTALNNMRIIDTRPIKLTGHHVEVLVREVTETADSYYVRIALRNGPDHSYAVSEPTVEHLEPSFAAGMPSNYIGQMIPDSVLHQFGFYTTSQLQTRASTLKRINLAPHEFVQWTFAFSKPKITPGIFRFTFPQDNGDPVVAVAIF